MSGKKRITKQESEELDRRILSIIRNESGYVDVMKVEVALYPYATHSPSYYERMARCIKLRNRMDKLASQGKLNKIRHKHMYGGIWIVLYSSTELAVSSSQH